MVACAAIVALTASHLFSMTGMGSRMGVLVAGLGSVLLLTMILTASSHPVFFFLDNRVAKFAGRVSYSYYLFNILTVDLAQRAYCFATGNPPGNALSEIFVIFAASTALGMAVASCSFYFVERPAIKLGGLCCLHPERDFMLPRKYPVPDKRDRIIRAGQTGCGKSLCNGC